MRTGSVINSLYDENRSPEPPKVGMGCTILMWTDRKAATVIGVDETGRRITVQEDKAIRTDNHGMSDAQSYEYERDPNGAQHVYTLRKNGKWIQAGERMGTGLGLLLGRRDHHHDFSF